MKLNELNEEEKRCVLEILRKIYSICNYLWTSPEDQKIYYFDDISRCSICISKDEHDFLFDLLREEKYINEKKRTS